jgi:hypothetical protein
MDLLEQIAGILALVACGASHEIDRDGYLSSFDAEVESREDGTVLLSNPDGTQYVLKVERIK